jgi:putative aldouronate transport system permease protein
MLRGRRRQLPLYMMILPGFLLLVVFSYLPMFGITIAFQKFIPAKGIFGSQKWIGLGNFEYVMKIPNFFGIILNTIKNTIMLNADKITYKSKIPCTYIT